MKEYFWRYLFRPLIGIGVVLGFFGIIVTFPIIPIIGVILMLAYIVWESAVDNNIPPFKKLDQKLQKYVEAQIMDEENE